MLSDDWAVLLKKKVIPKNADKNNRKKSLVGFINLSSIYDLVIMINNNLPVLFGIIKYKNCSANR